MHCGDEREVARHLHERGAGALVMANKPVLVQEGAAPPLLKKNILEGVAPPLLCVASAGGPLRAAANVTGGWRVGTESAVAREAVELAGSSVPMHPMTKTAQAPLAARFRLHTTSYKASSGGPRSGASSLAWAVLFAIPPSHPLPSSSSSLPRPRRKHGDGMVVAGFSWRSPSRPAEAVQQASPGPNP
eukprot:scaffold128434_cov34-Tisochrysis_lutea.AAC.1